MLVHLCVIWVLCSSLIIPWTRRNRDVTIHINMNPTYCSEWLNGGRRCYLSVRIKHIQRHAGALSSLAPVQSQRETIWTCLSSLLHTKRRTRPIAAVCYMLVCPVPRKRKNNDIYFTYESLCNHFCKIFLLKHCSSYPQQPTTEASMLL